MGSHYEGPDLAFDDTPSLLPMDSVVSQLRNIKWVALKLNS